MEKAWSRVSQEPKEANVFSRKLLVVGLVAGLVAGSLVVPAEAKKKKKKKKPKPVATTLYMHGNAPIGDGLEFTIFATEGTNMKMDGVEPADGPPKSFSYSFPLGNAECTGNPLFPSWEGPVEGTIVGDVTWMANFASAPGTATARLWVDIPFSSCTSSNTGAADFVDPISEVEVEIPAGSNEVEIVFEDVGVPVIANMIVEIHQTSPTNVGRIVYDSPDYPTRLEFDCIPPKGQKACISGE